MCAIQFLLRFIFETQLYIQALCLRSNPRMLIQVAKLLQVKVFCNFVRTVQFGLTSHPHLRSLFSGCVLRQVSCSLGWSAAPYGVKDNLRPQSLCRSQSFPTVPALFVLLVVFSVLGGVSPYEAQADLKFSSYAFASLVVGPQVCATFKTPQSIKSKRVAQFEEGLEGKQEAF